MVGITLTAEQIRAAPVEVRRWIEHELTESLGIQPDFANTEQPRHEHLVACNLEETAGVLSLIQGMFPVVNVFFELGRQGASLGTEGLEAFRLADIVQYTRLPSVSQAIACLEVINEAVRRVRDDKAATLYVLDRRGECIIAAQTQQSIGLLWRQVIARPAPSTAQLAEPSGLGDRQFKPSPVGPGLNST